MLTRSMEISHLPIDVLSPSPTNPRKHFDEDKHLKLTENVRKNGVMMQLIVRKNADAEGFEIVAGERRWRAATAAELKEVPVTIRELSDLEVIEIQMIENLQRQDMHPMEEAGGYQSLKDIGDMDNAGVAAALNVPESTVYRRLQLLKLEPKVKAAFMDGTIHVGHAEAIARLQPKDQLAAFEECFENAHSGGKMVKIRVSTRSLEHWISNNVFLDLQAAAFPKDIELGKAGPCTTCPKRTGFTPELFPDIAKKDTCTDRVCFRNKQTDYLKVAEKKLSEAIGGKKVQKISDSYFGYGREDHKLRGAGVIFKEGYFDAAGKKKCEHTISALIAAGPNVGKSKQVCTNTKCKVHKPVSQDTQNRKKITPEEKAANEKRLFDERVKNAAFNEGVKDFVNDMARVPDRDVALYLVREEIDERALELLGFDKDVELSDLKDSDLWMLFVAQSLLNRYWQDETKKLIAPNIKLVEKDVRARLKAEAKAAAKAPKGKKPTKGKMAAANDRDDEDEEDME